MQMKDRIPPHDALGAPVPFWCIAICLVLSWATANLAATPTGDADAYHREALNAYERGKYKEALNLDSLAYKLGYRPIDRVYRLWGNCWPVLPKNGGR